MGRKRWAMLATVLLLLAAAGCGAGGRPPAPGAHILVVLRADGSGRVDFWVGGGVHSDRELRDLGGRLAAVLFPGKTLRATAVEPGTAFPFARTEVPQAYGQGRHPTFDIPGRGVRSTLEAAGYPGYTLLVRPPRMRTSIGARTHPPGFEYRWNSHASGPPPAGSIVMRPSMLHWDVEMALLFVTVAAAVTALAGRDTRLAVAGCAATLVTAGTIVVTDRASGEALGALGYLSGMPLTLVTVLPFVALPVAMLAMIRPVRLLTRPAGHQHRYGEF
jgi:hypothetical protein